MGARLDDRIIIPPILARLGVLCKYLNGASCHSGKSDRYGVKFFSISVQIWGSGGVAVRVVGVPQDK